MSYPKANWPTVMNIAKSLLAVDAFYQKTCELMKSFSLPVPFVECLENCDEPPRPVFVFHTILEFVCSRISQIIENDSLSGISLEAVSEILAYFKEKQVRENKENQKCLDKNAKHNLLLKVAECEYKIASLSEISAENSKKTAYSLNKRPSSLPPDPGPYKKKKFVVEDHTTEYCPMDLTETENVYDSYYITKEEIKSQCIPLSQIPQNLLAKCKDEAPSSSLFLYNLPKKIQEDEIFKLLAFLQPEKNLLKNCVKIDILKGKLKGQGFLHLDSVKTASEIKNTLFGFPLQGKPLILVMIIQQYSKTTTGNAIHNSN